MRNTGRPFYNKQRRTWGGSTSVSSFDRVKLLTKNIPKDDIEFLLDITNESPFEEKEGDDDKYNVVGLSETNKYPEVDK